MNFGTNPGRMCLQHYHFPPTPNQQSWNIGKINHIALVTPDLDKSTALYRDVLGGKVSGKQVVELFLF